VIVDRTPAGELVAFDGVARAWRKMAPDRTAGHAFPIRPTSEVMEIAPISQRAWLSETLGHFRPLIRNVFLLSFLVNLSALALPLFVMHVYDLGIGTHSSTVVLFLSAGALIVIFTDLALRQVRARALAYFGARFDALIGMATFQQLLQLPIAMTEAAPVGTQISRLKQFESTRDVFIGTLASAIVDIPFILLFLVAVAAIGGHLVWVPATLLLVFGVLLAIVIPLTRYHVTRTGEAKNRLQLLVRELIAKRRAICDLNAEQIWVGRHNTLVEAFARRNYRAQLFNNFVQSFAQTLVGLAGAVTLGLGTMSVMAGTLSLGALIGVMTLVWRVLAPLQTTFLSLTRLAQATQTFQQINRLMKIRPEGTANRAHSIQRQFKGDIVLSRLVFRYPKGVEPVLRGVQLQIRSGETIAITGQSGCGKSTLLKVMTGLYPPTGGAVLVDGLDIRQLDPFEWRSAIAYAPEIANFFYGTVAQNLRLACPDATDPDVGRAFAEMGLDRYSALLPEGLETRLSGTLLEKLPAALKQRLLLARCFVKRAAIYLLDNPAVNLDTPGDAALAAKINALKGKATVIFTTFRPSHMRLADRVIVLKDGQIAIAGQPEPVIRKLAEVG
jgi:ABC-type bacteriocin/lantibiotic exporter with double-glycine peptidase domain